MASWPFSTKLWGSPFAIISWMFLHSENRSSYQWTTISPMDLLPVMSVPYFIVNKCTNVEDARWLTITSYDEFWIHSVIFTALFASLRFSARSINSFCFQDNMYIDQRKLSGMRPWNSHRTHAWKVKHLPKEAFVSYASLFLDEKQKSRSRK